MPTVALVATDFIDDHERSAETAGIAALPYARISDPLVSQEPARVWSIVDGAIDAVVTGLTSAPARDGGTRAIELRTEPWFSFRGGDLLEAQKEMNARLLEWQYSDGLPLVPATKAEVERMLKGTTRDRDEIVGILEPGGGLATVEKIAVNAVMAGCEPRHLPIVIAAVECLADHGMDLREKAISTGPAAPFIMVNGPARKYAGLNTGICMLGPGAPSHSNTVIGRALRLCMMNIGHTYPAISDMDTIGSPNKYSMCLAENEENSPWQPYNVLHGLPAGSSSVTVGFVYGLSDLTDYHSTDPETAVRKFATLTKHMGMTSTGFWLAGNRSDPRYGNREQEHHYVFLAPQHARVFKEGGWTQKEIAEAMYRHGRLPFGFLSSRLEHSAIRSAHPELAWLWDSPDTLVPVLETADCYEVIVAGSPGSNRSSFSWGMGGPVTKTVREEDLKL